MAGLRLGDRTQVDGRLQTLGLEASRKTKRFAITAAAPRRVAATFAQDDVIDSGSLLAAIELEHKLGAPGKGMGAIGELCPLEDVFLHAVFRFHPDHMLLGVVTAVRGAVRLNLDGRRLIVRNLIEVRLDEKGWWKGCSFAAPPLVSADAGSLVTTDEGRVIGLLVGGAGHVAYAAPVEPFLREQGLVHRQVNSFEDTEVALASLEAELAREPSFGLEEYLEAA